MRALILSGGASHGAFQAGAIWGLEDEGWSPDLICGTSVGAINGAGLASGLSGPELAEIWEDVSTDQVYRWRPIGDWMNILKWNHFFDTDPLESFLESRIDFTALHGSDIVNLCFATDVRTGDVEVFSNYPGEKTDPLVDQYGKVRRMDIKSILGSAAIPGVFPWVNGRWDGSFRLHAPLRPAVIMGAEEIVVIHIGFGPQEESLPSTLPETALKILDIASNHRYKYDLRLLRQRNGKEGYRHIPYSVISPSVDLGYSKLDFDSPKKRFAIDHGYQQARQSLDLGG